MNRARILVFGYSLAVTVWLNPVQSRAQATPQDDAGTAQLAEVVVTAQKRVESAQTTPVALSVYNGEDLARKGIADLQSLATNDASLNLTVSNGNNPYLTIRGISSQDTSEIGDPAVPVATDGFFTNRPFALLTSMYDLDRIEVLRGPQGTLYGRNAIGGVVNLVTAKPGGQFEAKGALEVGNYNTVNATGAVNIPFNDIVQLRVAYASNKHDGYRELSLPLGSTPTKGDDQNSHSGRIELAFAPTDHLYGLATVQIDEINEVGTVAKKFPFVPNPGNPGDIVHTLPAIGDVVSFQSASLPYFQVDEKTFKLEQHYDGLPGGTQLIYLGGYDSLTVHGSFAANGFIGLPFTDPVSLFENQYVKTQNHELRLVSPGGGRLTWQGGLYYFDERSENLYDHAVLNPGSTAAEELFSFLLPVVEDTSRAAFGQGDVKVTDTLKISAGARYTRDAKERTGVENVYAFNAVGIPYGGSSHGSKVTGHVGADWSPTESNFEYAKVDTGYKGGGFTSCNAYGPETVTTYEVGSKNRAFDQSVQLNVAAFLSEYKNQQIQTSVPASVCVSGSTVENAGSSRIYGVESNLQAILGRIGKADLTLNFMHARFLDFASAPALPGAAADCAERLSSGNCQLAGNTLPRSPTWSVAAGFEHMWRLPGARSLNMRLESRYQSKQYFDSFNYASTTERGYALANAYLDLSGDNWTVGAWVRNLANRTYFTDMEEIYRDTSYSYSFGAPRTYGMRFELTLH